jgi:pimeloyl-ACP methyl ester carboxylesterase
LKTYFLHDIPADVLAGGEEHARDEADIAFGQPCAIESWPRVSTKVIVGRDDRFFPVGFQRRVTRERLGCDTDEILGGHLVALSHPSELVDRLCEYIDHVEE